MHLLASHYQSEFLATPQLIRLDYAKGKDGFEPTLLVKGSTLLLKFMVLGSRLRFHLARVKGRLLYALTAYDDPSKPASLWSVVENEAEVTALRGLASGEPSPIFLFNELALNVAWSTVKASFPSEVNDWISNAKLGKGDCPAIAKEAGDLLERAFDGTTTPDELLSAEIVRIDEWHAVFNHFITSHGSNSPVDLFSRDEGGQQEQLAVWLTDSLHPRGVHHSPQIPKGNGTRELTDILLSHEAGALLIESKALTVFNRDKLPDRTKLAKDVSQHVEKAVRQLRGSIRRLKDGAPVTTRGGSAIDVERSQPAHAVVLIPEFDLIENQENYGLAFIADFMEATGGFIHLLDLAELLRVVQAAEMISRVSENVTPLMALDYCLVKRAEQTRVAGTLCIQVLLRMQE
ncbi:hypothetical protein BPS26883_02073 [Burkholderia pseudomultivorans]|uniref:Uncharacterized protein n=1 Tax=Burkholderia pseudomultivorans TaxID=1207504 RepID=A0A6P2JSS7_9BURK|nr:hypothetical protein [Burkholderia pseudomultivorans]VWB45255.1 hypothetical protein BPS26883_02073 [Burkholderia pseudomultivorans]